MWSDGKLSCNLRLGGDVLFLPGSSPSHLTMKLNRRNFLKTGTFSAIGATACAATTQPREAGTPTTEVPGYDYRRPSFKKGSRLLFQGDSITDMKWGRNQADRNHYLGHSYVYLIAARLGVEMPETELEFFNRGHSGNTVIDLRKRWAKDAIDMKPDLLSILIGTNDIARAGAKGMDLETWEADYRGLLDASRDSNPDLRIVLLDPFVLPVGKLANADAWKIRKNGVDQLGVIVAKIAKDYQAVHINTRNIFDDAAKSAPPAHWMWDGIHPLPQGHELIARHWLQEVSAR